MSESLTHILFPTFADAKRALYMSVPANEERIFRIALARANTEENLRDLYDYLDQDDMVFEKYHLALQLFAKLEKLKLEQKQMAA